MSVPSRMDTAAVSNGQPSELWRRFLKDRGLKESTAREAVVSAFFESEGHVDLQTLHARARRRHPGAGFATVYRTMKLLEEAGIAHARHFGGSDETLYELAAGRSHHDHLICESCARIVEFGNLEIERLQDRIAARHGFTLSRHRHELYGLCPKCRGKKNGDLGRRRVRRERR